MARTFLGVLLRTAPIALFFALMLSMSWLKWGDLIVDYGREVYVPWQISKGSLLYRDIASFYGPLSSYLNAALFSVFGASLMAMQLFNILLVGLLTYFIYRLFEAEGDRMSATVISCAFLVLFAFGKHFDLGSYNYVAPYSTELVHGVVLAFGALWAFKAFASGHRPAWAFMTGLFIGLALMTKMEITVALIGSVTPGFAIVLWRGRSPRAHALRSAALFVAGAVLPAALFVAFFSLHMGFAWAIKSVFSSWTVVAGTGISSSRFYKAVTGMDNLGANLRGMLSMAAWYLLVLIPLVLNYLLRDNRAARRFGPALSFFVFCGITVWSMQSIPWDLLFWPLPIFASAAALFFGVRAFRSGDGRSVSLFTVSAFSALMLVKVVFVTRVYGYGFVLAMPATLLVCYMLLSHLPAAMKRSWGFSGVFRYSVLAFLLVMLSFYLIKSYALYGRADYAVGEGLDTIIAVESSGGKGVDILLEQIEKVMAPDDDFIMLPEGTLINYLSRRDNPTRFNTFLPSDMTIFGEDAILEAIAKAQPDFVILISRDTIEYGVHYLGQGYGHRIFDYIMNGYSPIVRIGDLGFLEKSTGMGQPLGILIMRRNGA